MIFWLLNLIVFVAAQNMSEIPVLPDEENIILKDSTFREGAIVGMYSNSIDHNTSCHNENYSTI